MILVLDWIVDPPALRLAYRDALIWLIYPLVWVSLTLLRGAADGWYPYPFLNPVNGGYGTVAATVVSIIVGFFVLAIATIALGNARRATGGRGGRGVSPAR